MGWARMSDLQFQSPVFHYFRRKVRIHRRSFVLGCSRSSSVVDRRVTGKTVTLAARTAPAVRSGKRPGKTRRGCHRGVDTYRPREAGRQNSRSEMRDTRCMSDRVTGPFPWVGRASTKVALFRGRTARSQTPRAGRRYRAYLVPCRFWCAWCAALGPRTWFASHFFNGGQRQKLGNL